MVPYRIALADDHVLVRRGLRKILEERADIAVVCEAGDGLELMNLLRGIHADLVILDVSMPRLRGIEAIHEIRAAWPEMKVLILTMHKDKEYLEKAIGLGADGYLLKEDADNDLFHAIDAVRSGKVFISAFFSEETREDWVSLLRGKRSLTVSELLSTREKEVLKLIAEGKSSREIADLLCISARTVERHRANMMEKLKAKKSADLVKYAVQKGYV